MKKMFALVLALMLTLTACGPEEAALSAPETQPETTTEAATEATAEQIPIKILEPADLEAPERMPSGMESFNTVRFQNCTLELVDDETIKVNLYTNALYANEDVLSLETGEKVELRTGDEVYEATVNRVQEEDTTKGISPQVQLTCSGRELVLTPEPTAYRMEGKLNGFLALFPPKTLLQAYEESCTVDINGIFYTENHYTESGEEKETKNLTGADLIQRLKAQPQVFRMEHTQVWFINGQIQDIRVDIYP